MGPASQYVGRNQLYMRARAAGVGRYASVERRPLASHASNSKVADPPPRQRISSSSQRARPIPGTGRGVEGSTLTRQRVVAAVGSPKSAASAWCRQRRSARPIVPEPSAASFHSASCSSGSAASMPWATSSRIASRSLASCAALSGDSGQNDLSTRRWGPCIASRKIDSPLGAAFCFKRAKVSPLYSLSEKECVEINPA